MKQADLLYANVQREEEDSIWVISNRALALTSSDKVTVSVSVSSEAGLQHDRFL